MINRYLSRYHYIKQLNLFYNGTANVNKYVNRTKHQETDMRKILLPLLITVALPSTAQEVFSYTDGSGNTVYTNMPPENVSAKPVNVPSTQVVSPQTETPISTADQQSNQQNKSPLITNVILMGVPSDDGSLRANNGDFTVTVHVESSSAVLPSNYAYQLLLDGNPYGEPQFSNSFALKNIDRGTHTLQANILNNNAVIASSTAETFTVQRVAVAPYKKIQPRK